MNKIRTLSTRIRAVNLELLLVNHRLEAILLVLGLSFSLFGILSFATSNISSKSNTNFKSSAPNPVIHIKK